MSTLFPRVGKKALGYNVGQVDEFLATTRRGYDRAEHVDAHDGAENAGDDAVEDSVDALTDSDVSVQDSGAILRAEEIRRTAFAMHRGGYSPEHVDAALERLEDAFALRERDEAARAGQESTWMAEAEHTANVLTARLSRAPGHRFTRSSILATGYKRVDVDRFANKLVKFFDDGRELTVDEVRTAVFRPERGGYLEAQVDRVLDSVVDVMLMVR